MTQRWIVFSSDADQEQINTWMSLNKGVNGYFSGIPPRLQWLAEEEGWVLPHIWEEVTEESGSSI
jgi:hypothetical protein